MRIPTLSLLVLSLSLAAAQALPEEPPKKLKQPFLVYVGPADDTEASKDVMDSVKDLQNHFAKKRKDWFRLVNDPDEAEVVLQVVGRGETARHGSVLRGRCYVFDVQDIEIIGQGGLNPNQVFGIWGTAAADMAARLQQLLKAFYPTLTENRATRPRPAAALSVQRGDAQLERGEVEAALGSYEHALERTPEFMLARRGRGKALVEARQYERAIEDLSAVLDAKWADPATFFYRARAYAALGREAEADSDRRLGLSLVPRLANPSGGAYAPAPDEPAPDQTEAITAELGRLDAAIQELRRKDESYREVTSRTSSIWGKELSDRRKERQALEAAFDACRAGEQPVCHALAARATTGVAEMPIPATPPPPPQSVDKARLRVARGNLRSGPSTSDKVVTRLTKGALLALLDREPTGGWYPVVDVASAKQGWIHGDLLQLELAEGEAAARPSPFRGVKVADEAPPRVRVQNDSDLTLMLTLGEEHHSIPPRSVRDLAAAPGRLRYIGAAPGVLPAVGNQLFEQGHEYTWRFWIAKDRKGE
jgi:tetratricopeptide (TPR) repeat protein